MLHRATGLVAAVGLLAVGVAAVTVEAPTAPTPAPVTAAPGASTALLDAIDELAQDTVGLTAPPRRVVLVPEPPVVPEPAVVPAPVVTDPLVLPPDSGEGRRVVFSEGLQRVWLVDETGSVTRTYLVSGSRFDNLDPGTYAVQSRTRHAVAYDYSGTMEYFVRFTSGENAPIGFHNIPSYNDGTPEQTVEQLGTPLSAGCIRQADEDAVAMWEFGQVGTTVVVTA
ncbi:ErfK/YbiS/YcfS/YnhG [Aeromicrobium marinum DSM 15272]|uniref:ErfK/YbiS/YcfS/YnhG n=1 Tax=Aeromicrobium marinum DSM 15272 TaxID=585531 RepID=E2SE98_9ACTN|nr:ErfK/YbiS/YcfS/YnhG [Aeromicrobium marinum DSM 15272]